MAGRAKNCLSRRGEKLAVRDLRDVFFRSGSGPRPPRWPMRSCSAFTGSKQDWIFVPCRALTLPARHAENLWPLFQLNDVPPDIRFGPAAAMVVQHAPAARMRPPLNVVCLNAGRTDALARRIINAARVANDCSRSAGPGAKHACEDRPAHVLDERTAAVVANHTRLGNTFAGSPGPRFAIFGCLRTVEAGLDRAIRPRSPEPTNRRPMTHAVPADAPRLVTSDGPRNYGEAELRRQRVNRRCSLQTGPPRV